jgi:uncharacterized protein
MEKYQRPITSELQKRLDEPVRQIIMMAGPRQVGKTTAVHQVLSTRGEDSYIFYAVDSVESEPRKLFSRTSELGEALTTDSTIRDKNWLVHLWQKARIDALAWQKKQREQSAFSNAKTDIKPYVLALDEIQKIKDWSSVVKGLWDADRLNEVPLHAVILGSAPLLLQRGLNESLAGRFELLRVTHWSYSEMQEAFDLTLNEYIYFGGYPGPAAQGLIKDPQRWCTYVKTALIDANIDKDILALARVEKPALLRQLFELGSRYSGQIVALTKLVGQLQEAGNTTTLTHYLQLLQQAGLIAGLHKYSAQKIRQRAAAPKLNVLDTAFQSVDSGLTFAEAQADKHFWGRLVESAVGAHLLNTAGPSMEVSYWRESPVEVDFVLHTGAKLCAIEVKSSSKFAAPKGLDAFARLNPESKTLVVGGSDHALALALSTPAIDWFSLAER